MLLKSRIAVAVAVACAAIGNASAAGNTLFDDVTPNLVPNVPIPAGGPAEFTAPNLTSALVLPTGPGITITQTSIAQRTTQLANGQLNSGQWDMIDTNRTGADAGRYLFAPFEPNRAGGGSGVQRTDLQTGQTVTLVNPLTQDFIRGDASRWTPWGSYVTAEEDWSAVDSAGVRHGRLFELTNPVTSTGPSDANFVHRSVVPRVAHEGVVFDNSNNMYFIDELNGGSIYKYTSNNPNATSGDDYFASGQTFAAKVNGGSNANAVGNIVWTPITDVNGGILAGVTQTTGGFIDGTTSANTAGATDYQRPEDMEIKTLANGDQIVLIATTTTNEIYSMNLATNEMKLFASQATANAAGGLVGGALVSPDNLAIDADGNFYIIEDQGETNADIWLARDANNDGVAESLQRWAGMQVTGAEPTGLYFDIFKPNTAYLNIQHPTSGNDQLIMIQAVPEPGEYAMMLAGLGLVGLASRYRRKA